MPAGRLDLTPVGSDVSEQRMDPGLVARFPVAVRELEGCSRRRLRIVELSRPPIDLTERSHPAGAVDEGACALLELDGLFEQRNGVRRAAGQRIPVTEDRQGSHRLPDELVLSADRNDRLQKANGLRWLSLVE